MRTKLILLFLVVILLCSLQAQSGTSIKRKVIIGGDYNYPPYEFINDKSMPDGYNVELSRAICNQLNWEPEFRLAKWALVRQWLDAGEIDLVQGMAFSVDRARIMFLSDSHAQTWRSIFVRKGSKINRVDDILNATVVLQQGDIASEYLKGVDFKGVLIEVPTQEDALRLLDSGEYDAAIVNHMNGMYIIKTYKLKHLKSLPYNILQKEYCYAAKDQQLIDEINNALIILNKSGQLRLIQEKWFGRMESGFAAGMPLNRLNIIIFIFALLVVLGLIAAMAIFRAKYKFSSKALAAELNNKHGIEKELEREYSIFVRGPVILYKMQFDSLTTLMISDNVDQWGYTVDEILSLEEGFIGIVFPEDRDRYLAHSEEPTLHEYSVKRFRILTKSGEIRWVLDYATYMDSSKYKHLIYGYMLDITSQKNLEEQLVISKEKAESANIAKTHFLANMSHEIRTPLNGIMGFVQVLMQMNATPEQKEYYEIMYSSGRNLMKIVNDIIDFSKIESGKLDLISSDFNFRYLINDIQKPFMLNNKKPELQIDSKINERIPNVLFGDQLRLKQILINLLQNAVKFTEIGFVELSADVYTINEHDIRLLFCVSDSGIGIDPQKQQDIFDNFSQADPLITSKYGGTGLGLSIVKRLIELMSGFIWVESEPGKGSSFFFILPFALQGERTAPVIEQPVHPEIKLQNLPNLEVLLVEDEPINQAVTKKQLESWNVRVTLAANGQEALDLCNLHRYHAILMDIQMPVMDGITATQSLRLHEISQGIHTPIIAFTAAALVGDRERFLECGMDDYIAKPIEMNELYAILQKYAPPPIYK